MKSLRPWLIIVLLLVLGGALAAYRSSTNDKSAQPAQSPQSHSIVASRLEVPWDIAVMPDGDLLVTERPGQLRRIGKNGATYTIRGVEQTSEGGLLGLALHPHFTENKWLYVYLTTRSNGQVRNQVDRYVYSKDGLSARTSIIADIPGATTHDGGALAFGPDGKLYVGSGDANVQQDAQQTNALSGKILRLNDDGSVPADNPFRNPVWSYGHRNPQGIAWDHQGRLWATEHGPSGYDELNLIEKGVNYGWPIIRGDEQRAGMRRPLLHSGADETWAPAGLAYADGDLFFTGLRGQTLYRANISDTKNIRLDRFLQEEYGRLRAVTAAENVLYISTSNRDGRGTPADDDDRLLRIPLEQVE
ncbi:MAG TPA: PQQ-dependent sugar dehydrogenase [Candidatus Limnocylindrales bacterium]|nr:PQQ-dependent sugar dehydrogenase [Candidatus Limnocylindrales bacterium]